MATRLLGWLFGTNSNERGHERERVKKFRKYGWRPDLPDHRDKKFLSVYPKDTNNELPETLDLRDKMPAVYDQGRLGSCTANAAAAIFQYDQVKQGLNFFVPSRLFIYYCERDLEGTVDFDSGATMRDSMVVLNQFGVPNENDWPYDISQFAVKPPEGIYLESLINHAVSYYSIDTTIDDFKHALNSGFPVIFGFSVPSSFENFETAQTGIMKMPEANEVIVGGHAVVACGYDDHASHYGNSGYLLVRNSWGTDWGQGGYFWMPYDFVKPMYCGSCWVLETIVE